MKTAKPSPIQFDFKESLAHKYEQIKTKYLALGHILAIKDISSKVFTFSDKSKLEACGLMDCAVLRYGSYTYEKAAPDDDRICAQTLAVLTNDGRRRSVIIMRNDFPVQYNSKIIEATKICLLYHELGHADDIHKGINFDHSLMTCCIKRVEEYAEVFARRILQRIKCHKIVGGKRKVSNLWEWYRKGRHKGEYLT